MRRKQDNPVAKQKLLDAAESLVLTKGFVGTSVEDICRAAKLTKGSFFHYFESKDALGRELLGRYCANSKQSFASGCCCEKEPDPLRRAYGFIDYMIELSRKKRQEGCLLGSMAQEMAETSPAIRGICRQAFSEMASGLADTLKAAKAKYAPRGAFDPKAVAEFFVMTLEGAMLVGKANGDKKAVEKGLRHYRGYLERLFEK